MEKPSSTKNHSSLQLKPISRLTVLLSSLGISLAVFLSRFLGFIRDILVASALGAGPMAAAWNNALIAPNLFRKIFGEGAVGTAMVPIIAQEIEQNEDRRVAAQKLWAVLWMIIGSLFVIVSIIILIVYYLKYFYPTIGNEAYTLSLESIPCAMPYAIFICATGVGISALNAAKQFFWPMVSGILFNLLTIGLLVYYSLSGDSWTKLELLVAMSYSVTISGILQWVWILFLLKRHQLLCLNDFFNLPWKSSLSQLFSLSLPGLIGGTSLQVSTMIGAFLANSLGGYVVGALSYSDRIAYFPVGLIAFSLGTVNFSYLTSAFVNQDFKEFKNLFNFSLRSVLFLSIPLSIFIFFYTDAIVRVLFERGAFMEIDSIETVCALKFMALGIPSFCALKIVVSSFHAQSDMMTPMKIAICCNVINLVISVVLMFPFRQAGLTTALVFSTTANNIILLILLRKKLGLLGGQKVFATTIKSFCCAILSTLPAWVGWSYLPRIKIHEKISNEFIPLLIAGISFIIIFAFLTLIFKFDEAEPIKRRIFTRLGLKKNEQGQKT